MCSWFYNSAEDCDWEYCKAVCLKALMVAILYLFSLFETAALSVPSWDLAGLANWWARRVVARCEIAGLLTGSCWHSGFVA